MFIKEFKKFFKLNVGHNSKLISLFILFTLETVFISGLRRFTNLIFNI